MAQIQIVDTDANHLVVLCDVITFCVWKQRVTSLGLDMCMEAHRVAAQNGERDAGVFGIILPECEPPASNVRDHIVRSWGVPEFRIRAIVAVMEGRGIAHTAKRLAAAGYSMLNPAFRLCDTVDAGARHMGKRLSSVAVPEVAGAARECLVRAGYDARGSLATRLS